MEPSYAPGWYPDPARRFEFRYHNGQRWTADVSNHGQRYVDPNWAGVAAPYGLGGYQPGPSRALAITAFVVGLASLLVAWVPFVFVLGAAGAVVGVVFGVLALRRIAAGTATGKPLAVWGRALSILAVPLCVVGFFLSREVLRQIDELTDPGPYTIELTQCEITNGMAQAVGEVTNLDDSSHGYLIVIAFTAVTRVLARDTTNVTGVAPDEVEPFAAEAFVGVDDVECVVDSVDGFPP